MLDGGRRRARRPPRMIRNVSQRNRKAPARLPQGGAPNLGGAEGGAEKPPRRIRKRSEDARRHGVSARPYAEPTRKETPMNLAVRIIAPLAALGLIALCLLSQAPVLEKVR